MIAIRPVALLLVVLVAPPAIASSPDPAQFDTATVRSVPGGSLPAPRPAKTEGVLLRERFEGPWPVAPWLVRHGDGAADAVWGKTIHRASVGQRSIWCARTGEDAPRVGQPAPVRTDSWAIAGPFDLSGADSGQLSFDLWLETEPFQDVFLWLASTDGETFRGRGRSTDTSGWQTVTVNLADFGSAGNLIGEQTVWIAFVYRSDHSVAFEGAYVDEVVLTADAGGLGEAGRTYTSADDFELGDLLGLEVDSDRLVLAQEWTTFPQMWVPNPLEGTVSRIDTSTGAELARYRTGPGDLTLDPSGLAVDFEGRCWVANRAAGTVVRIGREDRGQCSDRDGDGIISTSRDGDGDGDITGDELLDWGADECVGPELVVVEGSEGVHTPGDEHELWADTILRGLAVSADGDLWAVSEGELRMMLLDGATGQVMDSVDLSEDLAEPRSLVVDGSGAVWVASPADAHLLRRDPDTGDLGRVELDHGVWDLALDGSGKLYATGGGSSLTTRVDVASREPDGFFTTDWGSTGISVTQDGVVWIVSGLATGSGALTVYTGEGQQISRSPLQNGPMATAVDSDGAVWTSGLLSGTLVRFDPVTAQPILQKYLDGTVAHGGLGDATGIVARTRTSRYGTWTVVHDSAQENTVWGALSWSPVASDPGRQRVRVRTSVDRDTWSEWFAVDDSGGLSGLAAGRWVEIEVALQEREGDPEVVLDELTIEAAEPCSLECAASVAERAETGAEVAFTASVVSTDCSLDAVWEWDFGDGETGSGESVVHVFESIGTYGWTLTGTAGAASCEAAGTIQLLPGQPEGPPLDDR